MIKYATNAEWDKVRNDTCLYFLSMSADNFIEAYNNGAFDEEDTPELMAVLSLFPELD